MKKKIKELKALERIKEFYPQWCLSNRNDFNIIEKALERSKNIEEELGIDLTILFRALKDGIWIKFDADFGRTGKPKIKIVKDTATGLCRRGRTWFIQESETKIKDYGKTWALTKEELSDE